LLSGEIPLLESLVIEQLPAGFASDEAGFFHALGFDDEQIAKSTERMKALPATPDWQLAGGHILPPAPA
jgi:hypothetical protein